MCYALQISVKSVSSVKYFAMLLVYIEAVLQNCFKNRMTGTFPRVHPSSNTWTNTLLLPSPRAPSSWQEFSVASEKEINTCEKIDPRGYFNVFFFNMTKSKLK
jgi:hypothetical protein